MSKLSVAIAIVGLFSLLAFGQTELQLDKAHSSVSFVAEHIIVLHQVQEDSDEEYLTMGVTEGQFTDFTIQFQPDQEDFSGSKIEAIIQVNSINTGNIPRDEHLKSEDFFDAEKYPQITFKSTSFTKTGQDSYKILGNLTMHGVTKPVQFTAKTNGVLPDNLGKTYISFTATGLLNRRDYGLKWSELLENGVFRISNYVQLTIQANFHITGESFSKK